MTKIPRFALLSAGIVLAIGGLAAVELDALMGGAVAMAAGVCLAALEYATIARRRQRSAARQGAELAALAAGTDKPGIDEDWVHREFNNNREGKQ